MPNNYAITASQSWKGCMVRKLGFLFLWWAWLGTAALAATPVTVQQMELLLAAELNQPDASVAKKISGLELTERASSARLSRWLSELPGTESREALLALADASAFLDLPAAEISPIAMPDAASQKEILARTIEYVKTTIHRLPNFSAQRSTTHFENQAPRKKQQSSKPLGPLLPLVAPSRTDLLHVLNRVSRRVTVSHGLEVASDSPDTGDEGTDLGGTSELLLTGLTTSGEFGPILSVVMGDAIRGQISWSHWEEGASGPLAVLRYSVPEEVSHYSVSFGVIGDEVEPQFPAYHGEIAVDRGDGTILRLTIQSELKSAHRIFRSGIVVEYGSVTIGNRNYTCPLRSEALSKLMESTANEETETASSRFLIYLNDVTFTEYRLFRGDVRVLP